MTETAQEVTPVSQAPKLNAILGRKLGMTQIFDDHGLVHGVTELAAGPCSVVAVKTKERDGYLAVTLGFGSTGEERLVKPLLGQFKKLGVSPCVYLKEIRVKEIAGWQAGQTFGVGAVFTQGDYVDVAGVSKGKGFAGGVKRWGFHGGPKTHGQSDRHRAPGSLAGRRSLGRVLPGKKMAGHMGHDNIVVYKLEVIKVDEANNKLYVKGGVPGPSGSYVVVHETVRRRKHRLAVKVSAKPSKKKSVAPAKK